MMIELKDLSFSYKKAQPLIKSINLKIDEGDHIGIMGPSGCGKSTLLKIINGTIEEESVKGKLYRKDELSFGSVYQNLDNQIIFPNVIDEIVFGMENMCYTKEMMDNKLSEVSKLLSIEHLLSEETRHLSGGEKQLLIMASILCLDVDVLILDECMSQVDEKGRLLIMKALSNLKSKGKTIIMVDHEDKHLKQVDKLFRFNQGSLTLDEE